MAINKSVSWLWRFKWLLLINLRKTYVEASKVPSGENLHDITFPEWPSNFTIREMLLFEPVLIYQSLTRSSLPQVATV